MTPELPDVEVTLKKVLDGYPLMYFRPVVVDEFDYMTYKEYDQVIDGFTVEIVGPWPIGTPKCDPPPAQ